MKEKHLSQAEIRYLPVKRTAFFLLAIVLFIYGLIAARNFLYPMAFGFVPAYLVYTPASWFEIKGIPHIPANLIAILETLALMSGFITAAYHIITPLTINFFMKYDPVPGSGINDYAEAIRILINLVHS